MNEAPKILWVEYEEGCWPTVMEKEYEAGTQYIRADIVEEMQKKLEIALHAFRTYQAYHEYRDAFEKANRNKGYAEQMEAALKQLGEV